VAEHCSLFRPIAKTAGSTQRAAAAPPHPLSGRRAVQAVKDRAVQLNARPTHRTGLPDHLKTGMESLSGIALDDVTVHRNSPKPAQLQAHAFAQGTDIHLAPGQEHHLPHEAWHVVQQKQGRVRATAQLKGRTAINDDPGLEREADIMGARALAQPMTTVAAEPVQRVATSDVAQCILIKVITRRQMTSRVVDRVEFADRVPTSASGGQGDHTVAEALIEVALEKHCRNKTHLEIAQTLPEMFYHLDTDVTAKYMGDNRKYKYINVAGLVPLIGAYEQAAQQGADGEDLNEMLSHILEMYLRIWNKRPGSAYLRGDKKTTGGSGGIEEKKAKEVLVGMSRRTDFDEDTDEEGSGWKLTVARTLTRFIDFNASDDLVEAAKHLATAINLTIESLEDGDQHYEHIATIAVQLFATMHHLDDQAEENLDRMTLFHLNGETYEEFEGDDDGGTVEEHKMDQ